MACSQLGQRLERFYEILIEIAAEISRIIRVHCHAQTRLQQRRHIVSGHRIEDAQLDIGQRADRQRNTFARQTFDQQRVIDTAHAMIDTFRAQQIQRVADVIGRAFLACMRHDAQTQFAAPGKDTREFFRRIAAFAAIESNADKMLTIGQRLLQRIERVGLAQMTQETQDQRAADAQLLARGIAGARQAADHRSYRNAARGMGLRVKKQLGVYDAICRGAMKIRHRHVKEILFMQQHARPGVIDIQKTLKVGKSIGGAQRLDAVIGQGHAVSLRQGKNQFRLQRAFDVHVEFGFGHRAQQFEQLLAGKISKYVHIKSRIYQ